LIYDIGEPTQTNCEISAAARVINFLACVAGSIAGYYLVYFWVGGGIILDPLQILLFGTMQIAIQKSLGVVFLSSMSACIGHTLSGNVLFSEGLLLAESPGQSVPNYSLATKIPDAVITRIKRKASG